MGTGRKLLSRCKKAGEELDLYQEVHNGERLLKSECHTKGMWFWSEDKGSSACVPVWELLQETSGENDVLRGIH